MIITTVFLMILIVIFIKVYYDFITENDTINKASRVFKQMGRKHTIEYLKDNGFSPRQARNIVDSFMEEVR